MFCGDLKRQICIVLIVLLVVPLALGVPTRSNAAPACGIVDAIDYPIDGVSIEHDDFGFYRPGFDGRHAGIDMAFGRYGDPVRAAARGLVTYSDPAGWDTEKGVIIIEHTFPDSSVFYSLYGHVEEINGRKFPPVGKCVEKGDIIASVGHPAGQAPHLHFEIRRMEASDGGPGYWHSDPLDGGWLHPIDFVEQWQLRLNPSYRSMITAGGGPTAPMLPESDNSVIFAEDYHLEKRSLDGDTVWRLDVQGLDGVINLPDGRILGRTDNDQIIIVDGNRFAATWQADRALRSPPLRLDDSVVFLATDNRAISYNIDGTLHWQTAPLGNTLESYAQSGGLLAVSAGQDGTFKLSVVDSKGSIRYQGSAPSPISLSSTSNGFIVMVGTQIGLLTASAEGDMQWKPLMDTGQSLSRNSEAAIDPAGDVVVYPGRGQDLYDYDPSGHQRWKADLFAPQTQPVLVGVGSGCLIYALTADGSLLAFRGSDGALRGSTSLYAGGPHGHPAARFLNVSVDDSVQFSAGYLSIATIDGPTLAAMPECAATTAKK